jgi:rhodanese-related sulfurtransferase
MNISRITVDEVKQKLDADEPVFIIDTRNSRDWEASDKKIRGAVRIHFSELPRRIDEIPRDQLIITYCT